MFQFLCELTRASVGSFLGVPDLDRLASTSRWMLTCPEFCPRSRKLSCEPEDGQDGACTSLCGASLGRLLRRGKGVCQEVEILSEEQVDPLCEALRHVDGLPLRSLIFNDSICEADITDMGALMQCGSLPYLHRLFFGESLQGLSALLAALGTKACPSLESLDLQSLSSEELLSLSEALEKRSGCAMMKELRVSCRQLPGGTLDRLLKCQVLSALERLELVINAEGGRSVEAMGAYLRAMGAKHLRKLGLSVPAYIAVPGGDVAQALAAGAAPHLESLTLHSVRLSGASLQALCQACGSESVFKYLKELDLHNAFEGVEDFATLINAITSSHGCPHLTTYKSGMYARGGVPRTLRDPHTFPSLECLELENMEASDLEQLAEALQQRPALTSLTELTLRCEVRLDHAAMSVVSLVLPRVPSLRQLHLDGYGSIPSDAMAVLAEVIRDGKAGSMLRHVNVESHVEPDGATELLQALVGGACPRLQSLYFAVAVSEGSEAWSGQEALAAVYSQAPCAATLEDVYLGSGCVLDAEGAAQLARAFRSPTSAKPQIFFLHCSSTTGVLDLIDALRGPAGSRLRNLDVSLRVLELEEEAEREAAEQVVVAMANAIEEGKWSAMSRCSCGFGVGIEGAIEEVGEEILKEALSARWRV